MKKFALLALLCAAPLFAQNCDAPITDNANVFGASTIDLSVAKDWLVKQGADVRVISDDPSVTPEQYIESLHRRCPSWQSAGGGVKNNLIVFLVFPAHHKMGVFAGSEYSGVLKTDILRTKYMGPSFRDKEYALGMVKGMNQAAIQIKGVQEAVLHPQPVIHQATDLHGLWVVMGWIVALGAIVGITWFYVWVLIRKRAARDAQQSAVLARNTTAKELADTRNWIETKEALKVNVAGQRMTYDAVSEDFASVSGSETYNPDTNGMSAAQYQTIEKRYQGILNTLRELRVYSYGTKRKRSSKDIHEEAPVPSTVGSSSESYVNMSGPSVTYRETYNTPVVVAPVFIEDPYRPSFPYDPPAQPSRYTEPAPVASTWSDNSSSSSYSNDSSSYSSDSSSSDFSSSDSGFSSDSGSSDF